MFSTTASQKGRLELSLKQSHGLSECAPRVTISREEPGSVGWMVKRAFSARGDGGARVGGGRIGQGRAYR